MWFDFIHSGGKHTKENGLYFAECKIIEHWPPKIKLLDQKFRKSNCEKKKGKESDGANSKQILYKYKACIHLHKAVF